MFFCAKKCGRPHLKNPLPLPADVFMDNPLRQKANNVYVILRFTSILNWCDISSTLATADLYLNELQKLISCNAINLQL